ncbi:MAG TPA: hypothetical protein PKN36_00785 [bacterium]|nr:hypothetical protein [bacterium]
MYGKDYICDKCGEVLMKCLSCGEVFCPNCDGDHDSESCPECNSDEIVTADIEDLVFDEDDDSEN